MNTKIADIGKCTIASPLIKKFGNNKSVYVNDNIRVKYNCFTTEDDCEQNPDSFEMAGPRGSIFFNPDDTRCAIVTCGGLSPGLNDVIRAIVMESFYGYGVKSIYGIKYGYNGLKPGSQYEPVFLTPQIVKDIHLDGGTILGSSRGGTEDMNVLADVLEKMKINILYTIGGDGTLKGAHELAQIALKRGMKLSVIGVPKTIDNDVSYVQRTFGFETAVSRAEEAIASAHIEAEGAYNGIGLVKLMGRHSGFIAAYAALAMTDVNFLLVPEVPFDLEGDNGLLHHLEQRLNARHHAVICTAEGAGQDLLVKDASSQAKDASGNVVLADVGIFLKDKITEYFKKKKIPISLKYIDPSYMIRSAPANANDSIYCATLGQFAVHAGMCGKTDMIIGLWNSVYTHMPMELVTSKRNQIDVNSRFWYNVIDSTGQPVSMVNK